ncbi:class F sortase [Streptomyces sp. J2-1]|uniref:class F sortase n=1 Tax=Streptomyces corallincola TaxID=2851888 RepID=UPI001C384DD6|nr:class F sortase [Streptomyces corallincola]MBV2357549.1 class F sortase [Streptomyces corallincola]
MTHDPAARHSAARHPGTVRLLTALAWTLLLLGLWMWGRGVSGGEGNAAPGDVAALGRVDDGTVRLPPAAKPLTGPAAPQRIDIPELGVQAPVMSRGLDKDGSIEPPPFDQPGVVGWYGAGTVPGAAGTALVVGHVDTATRPAVFYKLSTLRSGETVRVYRADGRIARFTVEDVRVLPVADFDPVQAYGPREPGRSELRLITCGGTFDRAAGAYTANVIVSAYLSGTEA